MENGSVLKQVGTRGR